MIAYTESGMSGGDAPAKALKKVSAIPTPAPVAQPLGGYSGLPELGGSMTGGPNVQSAGASSGVPGVLAFGAGNNLIGSQINPTASTRSATAGQYTQDAAAAYAGRQPAAFTALGPANTGGSQSLYDRALALAGGGGAYGGGSPYDGLSAQLNGKVSGALDKVLDGPDRAKLAADAYDALVARSQPGYESGLRDLGKRAAALGRVGAGMTTNELTDYGLARERGLDLSRKELATDAAGQSLSDRLAQLQAVRGVTGDLASAAGSYNAGRNAANQQGFDNLLTLARDTYGRERDAYGDTRSERDAALGYDDRLFDRDRTRLSDFNNYEQTQLGNDRSNRNELRGERDYQYGLDQDATRNAVQQALTEDQLAGTAFNRSRDLYDLGTRGSPAGAYDAAAKQYGGDAQSDYGSLGDLFSTYAYNRARRGQPATAPAATVPAVPRAQVRDILASR